jgi:hypothetical protein
VDHAAVLEAADKEAFFAAFPRLVSTDYRGRSKAEKRRLVEDEYIAVDHEIKICKLIYSQHGCDSSWEDIFRDNVPQLKEKLRGIRIALSSDASDDDDDDDDDEVDIL